MMEVVEAPIRRIKKRNVEWRKFIYVLNSLYKDIFKIDSKSKHAFNYNFKDSIRDF